MFMIAIFRFNACFFQTPAFWLEYIQNFLDKKSMQIQWLFVINMQKHYLFIFKPVEKEEVQFKETFEKKDSSFIK